mmetsp:Transcript_20638/g.57838  ORF Transcript_20638/g.57838 Transcript_20638/m.57838 type:complete len:677 (+) Transcript_20638:87-2117(+)
MVRQDDGGLVEWLREAKLDRHIEGLMDAGGGVGITSLEDLHDLGPEDVDAIGAAVGMNIVETKRFLRALQNLKAQNEVDRVPTDRSPASPQRSEPQEALKAFENLTEDAEVFEVVKEIVFVQAAPSKTAKRIGGLRKGQLVQVWSERERDNAGNDWAELTPLQLVRSADATSDAEQGFVLIDGAKLGLGQLLRGPLPRDPAAWLKDQGAPGAAAPEEAPAGGAPATGQRTQLQEALKAFDNLAGDEEVFEVVKSVVFVQATPSKAARRLGAVRGGELVQVHAARARDEVGNAWAELTPLQLGRCIDVQDEETHRGFVLIDGTTMGLGLLLKGPLSRDPADWMMGKANAAASVDASLGDAPPYADFYQVLNEYVFIKGSPSKDAASIGCLSKGNLVQCFIETVLGDDGHAWVELTSFELWHSGAPEAAIDRGFALIDGSHLKLGKLLQGPLASGTEWASWSEQRLAKQKEREDEKRKQQADWTNNALKAKDVTQTRDGLPLYRYQALHDTVSVKWSADPRSDRVQDMACVPGTLFCSTGMDWWGSMGHHWIDGYSPDGKPHWLLVDNRGENKQLVPEAHLEGHVCVVVKYITLWDTSSFTTYFSCHSTVRALKLLFSTNKMVPMEHFTLKKARNQAGQLAEGLTLLQAGITDKSTLYAEYSYEFFAAMKAGRIGGWL